jgi:protein O-GlcNAc transferase
MIFWTWLRILTRVQHSILWLLRFPAAGEPNLLQAAIAWAGPEVASRIRFTDVALKEYHIARCCVPDLVLDTAEVRRSFSLLYLQM